MYGKYNIIIKVCEICSKCLYFRIIGFLNGNLFKFYYVWIECGVVGVWIFFKGL